jgi:hypothetical protein
MSWRPREGINHSPQRWIYQPADINQNLEDKTMTISTATRQDLAASLPDGLPDGKTDIDPKTQTGSNFAYRALRWALRLPLPPDTLADGKTDIDPKTQTGSNFAPGGTSDGQDFIGEPILAG